MAGLGGIVTGGGVLALVYYQWVSRNYAMADSVFLPALGTMLVTLGFQTVFGGFLLAIIGGNESRYLSEVHTRNADHVPSHV